VLGPHDLAGRVPQHAAGAEQRLRRLDQIRRGHPPPLLHRRHGVRRVPPPRRRTARGCTAPAYATSAAGRRTSAWSPTSCPCPPPLTSTGTLGVRAVTE